MLDGVIISGTAPFPGRARLLRLTYGNGQFRRMPLGWASAWFALSLWVGLLVVAQAEAANASLSAAALVGGIQPGVRALAFKNTAAAWFTDSRRQLSGSFRAGPYLALYTVGYADGRPREPVTGDSYADGEMTSVGSGVAQAVLAKVGAPVRPPRCPGTPGC
jgi:hypothetical protein